MALLGHRAQPVTIGAEQLEPEDRRDLENRADTDCWRSALNVPQRDGRDAGSLG